MLTLSVQASVATIPISQDAKCGAQANWTNTCFGSKFGDCCSYGGQYVLISLLGVLGTLSKLFSCGTGDGYCGISKCQEGDCNGGRPFSTDGRCGKQNRELECGGTAGFGTCCSSDGW